MNTQAAQDEVHIASFVVQHRETAAAALDAVIAAHGDLELAVRGPTRSVVLCESADRYAVMDRVEALRVAAGVLNVLLVYHHAEPREALDAAADFVQESVSGAQP